MTVVDPEPPEPAVEPDPTVTVTVPVEAANVELPEYVATMTCDPEVEDEKVYVADPLESARDEFTVVPSTVIATVPVGVAVTELDCGATAIVITSLTAADGLVFTAESVVVVAYNDEPDVSGHAVSRL